MSEAPAVPTASHPPSEASQDARARFALAVGALGVVFGDIGTSPLYAVKECFHGAHSIHPLPHSVLGILSLIFWSLIVVISLKYLTFIMRADNRGEGGIFALLALLSTSRAKIHPAAMKVIVVGALIGSALLYGDGIITPAISVLSAVEGLEVATDTFEHLVVPITCVILFAVFAVQKTGTAGIGGVFGPIMAVWFATIAVLGIVQIAAHPAVLSAVNPWHAVRFFAENGGQGFVVLGSVVLCITGGEALYADMGHFGWKPIKYAWYGLVVPALLLNYFGQGALLLNGGGEAARANPFFAMVPRSLLIPMVVLATTAAVIASQALISGAFSLTRSAVQLGFLPRLRIVHTSHETRGQIYIRGVNVAMGVACILLVLGFRRSTALAGAYGIAVTAVMAITSTLWWFVADRVWRWRRRTTVPLLVLFLMFDVGYFAANIHKIPEGGWVPIAVALAVFAIMGTWHKGREALYKRMMRATIPLKDFVADVEKRQVYRVPGTAVFMSAATSGTPPVLLHHLKHNKVLHDQVVMLSIQVQDVPKVDAGDRLELESYPAGFYRVVARYGYMETPHVPSIFVRAESLGLKTNPMDTSFYLGRETLLTSGDSGLLRWRKKLFAVLSKNATNPTSYFGLPPGRVIELGMQVDL